MKALMRSAMTCAVLSMMCTSAFAGGDGDGGAKGDGTIAVTNNYDGQVMAVAVGSNPPSTVSGFLAQGAQFLQPGETATFSVAPGNQTVTALFIDDVNFGVVPPVATTVNVVGDQTTNISGDPPGVLN